MNKTITFALAAASVLTFASCNGKKAASAQNQTVEHIPSVRIIETGFSQVNLDQNYSVTLQPYAVNNIAPQTAARIVKVNAEVGDFVSAGQTLAEMDRLQLDQAELQLANAKDEYQRTRSLYEKGGVSKSDFDAVELSYKVKESSCRNLRENTILLSPLNGVVTARNYDQGDMYSMSSPLFVVQQINPIKVLVSVSEKDYSNLKKGVKVEITPEALPGKSFTGSVVRVHPTIDPATHTVTAEVHIPNKDAQLRPGMYAGAKVIFGTASRILVPDTAVQKIQGSGQKSVYVLGEDNIVSVRLVEVGRHIGSNYEVLSGLNAGEKVVVNGQSTLRAGTKVEVLK